MLLVAALIFLLVAFVIAGLIGALCTALARMAGASPGWTIAVGLLSAPVSLAFLFMIMASG